MPYSEGFVNAYDQFTLDNALPIATDTVCFSTFCHRIASGLPINQQIENVLVARGRFTSSDDWLFVLQQQSLGSLLRFLNGPKDAEAARFGLGAIRQVQKTYDAVRVYRLELLLFFVAMDRLRVRPARDGSTRCCAGTDSISGPLSERCLQICHAEIRQILCQVALELLPNYPLRCLPVCRRGENS